VAHDHITHPQAHNSDCNLSLIFIRQQWKQRSQQATAKQAFQWNSRLSEAWLLRMAGCENWLPSCACGGSAACSGHMPCLPLLLSGTCQVVPPA
jgi:hypothetical protein